MTWRPDVKDVHVYGGLGLATFGAWQFSPALAALGAGVVLLILGVFGERLRRS